MRVTRYILCLLLILPLAVTAQNNKNLTKTLMGKIGVEDSRYFIYVKHGEFKIDFDNKIADQDLYKKVNKYLVIVRDKKGNVIIAKTNNYALNLNKDYTVEVLRAGYTIPDFVYTEKRSTNDGGKQKYKYYLIVDKKEYGPYDQILDMFKDGFVYKNGDDYFYKAYDMEEEMRVYLIIDEAKYDQSEIKCHLNDKYLIFKPEEKVRYYRTRSGHYYLLYDDKYMDNTLLVVDSVGYELDGVVEKVNFSFSQDGEHWIAAYPNNLMVDGVVVKRLPEKIKNVAIKNDGQYAYVTEGKGMNDVMYIGDEVLVKGVDVKWLSIDGNEQFNYIFNDRKGCYYGIGYDISDKGIDNDYFYPSLVDNTDKTVVKSNDGKHTMTFSYDTPYIMIDDVRIDCPSIPHYAKWDEGKKRFIWNAVEDVNLYLYTYKVRRK